MNTYPRKENTVMNIPGLANLKTICAGIPELKMKVNELYAEKRHLRNKEKMIQDDINMLLVEIEKEEGRMTNE